MVGIGMSAEAHDFQRQAFRRRTLTDVCYHTEWYWNIARAVTVAHSQQLLVRVNDGEYASFTRHRRRATVVLRARFPFFCTAHLVMSIAILKYADIALPPAGVSVDAFCFIIRATQAFPVVRQDAK